MSQSFVAAFALFVIFIQLLSFVCVVGGDPTVIFGDPDIVVSNSREWEEKDIILQLPPNSTIGIQLFNVTAASIAITLNSILWPEALRSAAMTFPPINITHCRFQSGLKVSGGNSGPLFPLILIQDTRIVSGPVELTNLVSSNSSVWKIANCSFGWSVETVAVFAALTLSNVELHGVSTFELNTSQIEAKFPGTGASRHPRAFHIINARFYNRSECVITSSKGSGWVWWPSSSATGLLVESTFFDYETTLNISHSTFTGFCTYSILWGQERCWIYALRFVKSEILCEIGFVLSRLEASGRNDMLNLFAIDSDAETKFVVGTVNNLVQLQQMVGSVIIQLICAANRSEFALFELTITMDFMLVIDPSVNAREMALEMANTSVGGSFSLANGDFRKINIIGGKLTSSLSFFNTTYHAAALTLQQFSVGHLVFQDAVFANYSTAYLAALYAATVTFRNIVVSESLFNVTGLSVSHSDFQGAAILWSHLAISRSCIIMVGNSVVARGAGAPTVIRGIELESIKLYNFSSIVLERNDATSVQVYPHGLAIGFRGTQLQIDNSSKIGLKNNQFVAKCDWSNGYQGYVCRAFGLRISDSPTPLPPGSILFFGNESCAFVIILTRRTFTYPAEDEFHAISFDETVPMRSADVANMFSSFNKNIAGSIRIGNLILSEQGDLVLRDVSTTTETANLEVDVRSCGSVSVVNVVAYNISISSMLRVRLHDERCKMLPASLYFDRVQCGSVEFSGMAIQCMIAKLLYVGGEFLFSHPAVTLIHGATISALEGSSFGVFRLSHLHTDKMFFVIANSQVNQMQVSNCSFSSSLIVLENITGSAQIRGCGAFSFSDCLFHNSSVMLRRVTVDTSWGESVGGWFIAAQLKSTELSCNSTFSFVESSFSARISYPSSTVFGLRASSVSIATGSFLNIINSTFFASSQFSVIYPGDSGTAIALFVRDCSGFLSGLTLQGAELKTDASPHITQRFALNMINSSLSLKTVQTIFQTAKSVVGAVTIDSIQGTIKGDSSLVLVTLFLAPWSITLIHSESCFTNESIFIRNISVGSLSLSKWNCLSSFTLQESRFVSFLIEKTVTPLPVSFLMVDSQGTYLTVRDSAFFLHSKLVFISMDLAQFHILNLALDCASFIYNNSRMESYGMTKEQNPVALLFQLLKSNGSSIAIEGISISRAAATSAQHVFLVGIKVKDSHFSNASKFVVKNTTVTLSTTFPETSTTAIALDNVNVGDSSTLLYRHFTSLCSTQVPVVHAASRGRAVGIDIVSNCTVEGGGLLAVEHSSLSATARPGGNDNVLGISFGDSFEVANNGALSLKEVNISALSSNIKPKTVSATASTIVMRKLWFEQNFVFSWHAPWSTVIVNCVKRNGGTDIVDSETLSDDIDVGNVDVDASECGPFDSNCENPVADCGVSSICEDTDCSAIRGGSQECVEPETIGFWQKINETSQKLNILNDSDKFNVPSEVFVALDFKMDKITRRFVQKGNLTGCTITSANDEDEKNMEGRTSTQSFRLSRTKTDVSLSDSDFFQRIAVLQTHSLLTRSRSSSLAHHAPVTLSQVTVTNGLEDKNGGRVSVVIDIWEGQLGISKDLATGTASTAGIAVGAVGGPVATAATATRILSMMSSGGCRPDASGADDDISWVEFPLGAPSVLSSRYFGAALVAFLAFDVLPVAVLLLLVPDRFGSVASHVVSVCFAYFSPSVCRASSIAMTSSDDATVVVLSSVFIISCTVFCAVLIWVGTHSTIFL